MKSFTETTEELSTRKRCLILILLLGLCFIASSTNLTSYDFWWHLKNGEMIYERGEIPKKDLYSFTSHGTPRIAHEWMAELLFYMMFRGGGIPAIILWKAIIVSASFFLIISYLLKRNIPSHFIGISILLSLWGARFRFSDRTELFSLFFATIILFLLYDSRRSGHRRKLYAIVLLTLLWANLHGAAILSPLFVLLFIIGEILHRFIPRHFQSHFQKPGEERELPGVPLFHLFAVLFLVFCSTLLNPNGIQIWKASVEAKVIHSSGFAINTEWVRPELGLFPLFYAAVIIFLLVSALSIKKIDFSKFLITLFLAVLALIHLRAIGMFFFALPFFLAIHLPHVGMTPDGREFLQKLLGSRGAGLIVAVLIILSFPYFLFHKGLQEFGYSMKQDRFPVDASQFLERHYEGEFLYNDVKFGGYLIWESYPERKVFIDGRNELYAPLVQRISKGLKNYDEWLLLLDDYEIDAALVSYWPSLKGVLYPPDSEMGIARRDYRAYSAFLFLREEWALVYWDDVAMVFFKRVREHDAIIDQYEYKYLNPEDWRYLLSRSKGDEDLRQKIIHELSRRLREEPASERARALYEVFIK
jgi:hypothetical protein